tara:strand:- start:7686 stop:8135 length:450 start_codon:yes stop_codon:yes gene_type:complete
MNKQDLSPERISKMIIDFFTENELAFSTTRAENYNKNLKWLQDRKIPKYSITNDRRYGDVISFDKPPDFLILYSPEFGGYVQYITPKTRRYASLDNLTKFVNDEVTIDTDTGKYIYGWGLEENYDLTELILGKNTPFLNWTSFEPWNEK